MRILFAGTPEAAVPSLQALVGSRHEVVAVLTRPDKPVGRKRVLTPSPVKAAAVEAGLTVLEADRLRWEIIENIAALAVDAVAVVAYGALAGPRSLVAVPGGWFNLHFSLLPDYRGAAPVQRAIMDGLSTSGATVFRLDAGLDTGDIIAQEEYPLGTMTAGEALADFAERGAGLLVRAFDELAAGTARFRPQPADGSQAPKLTQADGYLNLGEPAAALAARARGVTPAPGAWCLLEGKKTKLAGASCAPTSGLAPGETAPDGSALLIGTADGSLRVQRVQPFGKPMMAAADFLRGHPHARFAATDWTTAQQESSR